MNPIIIIGTGLAGYHLAKEFRKINTETPLLLISKDEGYFYSKPLLSTAFSYKREISDLYVYEAQAMESQLQAKILTKTHVTQIHPQSQQVTTEQDTYSYSKLVLASGATVIRAPINGDAADQILSINNLSDYAKFRHSLNAIKQAQKRIAILGAGLLGCELANDLLHHKNCNIDVISLSPYPADRLLPPIFGQALQNALSEAGICWHLEQEILSMDKAEPGYELTLSPKKETLKADLVISAIGIKPHLQLAKTADLKTSLGVIVDTHLQTSNPNIYALGDCAEVNGLVLPFIAPILQCSRALAKTLNGEPTEVKYPAMPIVFKTPACPIVISPPQQDKKGEWVIQGNYPNLKALFLNEKGDIFGFALSGQAIKERQILTQAIPAFI